jgi:hypothetical protein
VEVEESSDEQVNLDESTEKAPTDVEEKEQPTGVESTEEEEEEEVVVVEIPPTPV